MKWSKLPAYLVPEKTFLVIRRNLQVKEEKNAESDKTGVSACTSCETWSPKMRKKGPMEIGATTTISSNTSKFPEEPNERPATANLEAPLILDPRLIDKLDMSMLSKESLNASLTRISLGNTTIVSLICEAPLKIPTESIIENNYQPLGTTTTRLRARFAAFRKTSFDSSEPSDTKTTAMTSNEGASSPESNKKLDNNNNKNKVRNGNDNNAMSQLALLRTQGTHDLSIRKKLIAITVPEPCCTCGRSVHPERFHSHPRSPTSPTKDAPLISNSVRSTSSTIPIRKTVTRKLDLLKLPSAGSEKKAIVAMIASPKSDQQIVASTSVDENTSSEEIVAIVRKERKTNSATFCKSIENKSRVSTGTSKRRPRTVTCYICGREFGTASFPIHEPKCLQKWQRENKALRSSQRRNTPQRPNVSIDHEDWNNIAWEQSQALLIPCLKCKRTFLPDRLAIHERNCRVPNKILDASKKETSSIHIEYAR